MSLKDSHRDAKWRGQGEGECMPDYTILFRIVGEQKMPSGTAMGLPLMAVRWLKCRVGRREG